MKLVRISACAVGLWLAVASAAQAGGGKVQICHVPPGNPANAHEIVVGGGAVNAHLSNHPGDRLGPCVTPPECQSDGECDDANPCSVDTCTATGTCDHGAPVACDDGDPCTNDVCIAEQGGCVAVPNPGATCDDGDLCTGTDVCDGAGQCSGTAIEECCRSGADCGDQNACTSDVCDTQTGECSHSDATCPEPAACEVAFCSAETGCEVAPVSCPDDGDVCTVSRCDPGIGLTGACITEPNPNPPEPGQETSCSDGLDNDCDGLADTEDSDCSPVCIDEPNLVLNHGFEVPALASGFVATQSGGTLGDVWTIGQGSIDVVSGQYWEAAQGLQSLDLNGNTTPGSVHQDLATTPGLTYEIKFALAGNPEGFGNKRVLVFWDGAQVADITFVQSGNTLASMGYLEQTLELEATDTSTRLEFRSASGSMSGTSGTCACYGAVIDDVRVAPLNDATCDDANRCTVDSCDAQAGDCSHRNLSCPEPSLCEVAYCDPQTGCQLAPKVCADDGNPCTIEVCDLQVGCRSVARQCAEDQQICTLEICDPEAGGCTSVQRTCPVHNDVCTIGRCDPSANGGSGNCVYEPNPNPPEPMEFTCNDGVDNDCDGAIDLADSNCLPPCPCVTLGLPFWNGSSNTLACYRGPDPLGSGGFIDLFAVGTKPGFTYPATYPSGPIVGSVSASGPYGCGSSDAGASTPGALLVPGSPEAQACIARVREIATQDGVTCPSF